MPKGFILYSLKTMSRDDRRAFDRWLTANALVGLIFAAGLIAMALVGSYSPAPKDGTLANSMQNRGVASSFILPQ